MKININSLIKITVFAFLIMFSFENIVFADSLRCTDLGDIKVDLQNLFNVLKIILPLLVIGLSVFDFIKAITGKDEKDVKKAFTRFLKRIALAIVFFFLPILINALLDFFMIDTSVCVQ